MISVVLPCLNELRHSYLHRILENLSAQQGSKELIAALSPCTDHTLQALQQFPEIRIIETDAQNRAQRLNAGIQASQGDIVLLHHPATLLPPDTALLMIEALMANPAIAWGGFRHHFDMEHWLLNFTSWYSNTIRPRWGKVLYLDHCIFVRRPVLDAIQGIPDLDIFEDTALSHALQAYSPPQLLPAQITTSARRFQERGIFRQALVNQILKLMYHAQLNPQWLNKIYERKTQINVIYTESTAERELPSKH